MRKTKFTRLLCLTLAMLLLVSSAVLSVSADERNNTTDKSITDYVDELNTISYEEYMAMYSDYFSGSMAPAKVTVEFDATKDWSFRDEKGNTITIADGKWTMTLKADGTTYNTLDEAVVAGYKKSELVYVTDEFEGKSAIYTPSMGATTWTLDLGAYGITNTALYNISLVYYPVSGKSVAIEREFYINSEAPFAEARSLSLAKIWALRATDGSSALTGTYVLKDSDDINTVIADANAAGVTYKVAEDGSSITVEQPRVINSAINAFVNKYSLRFFTTDMGNNEMRPSMQQAPEWTSYTMHDSDGFYGDDFGFALKPDANGELNLTLEGVNEPMAIAQIILTPYTTSITYEEYLKRVSAQVSTEEGTDVVKIEAEYPTNTSTNVVFPVEDRTSALTSPADTHRTLLNTIGTEKWATAGQWIQYQFSVNDSGMYDIYSRFQQSYLDGMYVSRILKLYTDCESVQAYTAKYGNNAGYYNGVPFAEASALRYNYSSGWQVTNLTNDSVSSYKLYLEAGVVYTLHLEVTLGTMSSLVQEVEDILTILNNDYLSIIKLTGSSPDDYRDYNFNRLLPDTLMSMYDQSKRLAVVSQFLKDTSGDASTYTGICDKLVDLLKKMVADEDAIAKNLDNFKSYVGSLGTFLTDAKTQPLELDYITIQPSTVEPPKGDAGFFKSLIHELSSFIQSFFRDYNHMGAMETSDAVETISVWVPYGRDQANVIRNLSTNQFTQDTKISVDLKLVVGSTLLPSILAGMGPDVYLGLGQASVINYAIRGALINIEDMEGFDEATANFNDAAMLVLGTYDADGELHYYGLPENQEFAMMFVRVDILAELGIEIPTTWEEIYVAQSKLESNNMEIGVTTSYKIHLYQMEGELFADNGMRINLDSIVGLNAFETMCDMFTQFSFPYKYDAANRFRTGEMPIIISNYTSLYNKLKVYATEIEGCWTFVPVPGYEHTDENGNTYLNNESVANVDATVMISGVKNKPAAWEYIKWYTGAACQVAYANEMVAIIGDSAKHPTANRVALESMPWTREEYEEVSKQYENLASVPNYPGYYIIDRYTDFAFLSAYNDDADPSTEILSYINTINKEITRKREEFKLETLEIGQTLADKRKDQALEAMKVLEEINASKYSAIMNSAKYAIANEKINQLKEVADNFSALLSYDYLKDIRAIEANKALIEAEITTAKQTVSNKVKTQTYYMNVTKQTAEPKNGGYSIDSLNEEQLVYFISVCLDDMATAIASYQ
ncbi:MAG: extracellular solute-binding protein [Clostridia bacterium]|nr:extracellular solute-binding protein [Clostridia bacterium]